MDIKVQYEENEHPTASSPSSGDQSKQSSSPYNRSTKMAQSTNFAANHHSFVQQPIVQDFLVVWLDLNIDELNYGDHNSVTQLYHTINTIDFFVDVDRCIDYITEIQNQKVFLVVSCAAVQCLAPCIQDIRQIDLICIFCLHQCNHGHWTRQCPKVKGIFSQISAICESVKKAARQYNQNSIAFSLVSEVDARNKNLDELDQSFMYTQLFKEILIEISFDEQAIQELTDYWRDQFASTYPTLEKINKFEKEYYQHPPIWWYTYESLLYEILNRALRALDVETIMKMGFFLKDLHGHIERLYSEQTAQFMSEPFTVYQRWARFGS